MSQYLPYFDFIIHYLEEGNESITTAFEKNVHWGYWDNPKDAQSSAEDFSKAGERLIQKIGKAALVENGQSLLDAGCGFGGTIYYLNKKFSNMNLVGINIDERQLLRAENNVIAQNNNTISFEKEDACKLPFSENTFDTILALESIFHFQNRKVFFEEAFRVLKPGGILTFSDFIPKDEFVIFMILMNIFDIGKNFFGNFYAGYTRKDYLKLAMQTGFALKSEEDITDNTLPTYNFLWSLKNEIKSNNLEALTSTYILNFVNSLKLIQYHIYSFQKT